MKNYLQSVRRSVTGLQLTLVRTVLVIVLALRQFNSQAQKAWDNSPGLLKAGGLVGLLALLALVPQVVGTLIAIRLFDVVAGLITPDINRWLQQAREFVPGPMQLVATGEEVRRAG